MKKQTKQRLINGSLYVSYGVITLVFLFPVLWVLSLSLKTREEVFSVPPNLFPSGFAIQNYIHVLSNTGVVNYLGNSFQIVFLTVVFTLIIAVPAAYGLSRFRFKFKKYTLILILVTQMISAVVISIPLYRFFAQLDLLNNYVTLILVYVSVVLPFSTWFMKNFLDTIPKELDEAAIVDGCNRWQLLTKILLPLSIPGVISVTILISVQSWSQFVIPFILLDNQEMYPVSVGIINLQSHQETITTHYLAAGSIISIIPVILLFVIMQKYIVAALMSGAVKG